MIGNSRFYKRSFQAKAEENRKGHVSLIKHEAALQGYTCLVSTLFIKQVLWKQSKNSLEFDQNSYRKREWQRSLKILNGFENERWNG